jgi:hypothetical protein
MSIEKNDFIIAFKEKYPLEYSLSLEAMARFGECVKRFIRMTCLFLILLTVLEK